MSQNSEAKKKKLIVNNNFYIENKTKHNTKQGEKKDKN